LPSEPITQDPDKILLRAAGKTGSVASKRKAGRKRFSARQGATVAAVSKEELKKNQDLFYKVTPRPRISHHRPGGGGIENPGSRGTKLASWMAWRRGPKELDLADGTASVPGLGESPEIKSPEKKRASFTGGRGFGPDSARPPSLLRIQRIRSSLRRMGAGKKNQKDLPRVPWATAAQAVKPGPQGSRPNRPKPRLQGGGPIVRIWQNGASGEGGAAKA